MLDLKSVEKNPERYKKGLANRGADPSAIDRLLQTNEKRKKAILEAETLTAQQNKINSEIAQLKKKGEDASGLISQMKAQVEKIKALQAEATSVDEEVRQVLAGIPNIQHESVPVGKSSDDNKVKHTWGEKPQLSFKPKEHWEIGEKLGVLDFARGGKVTGAGFTFVCKKGARLERALINFMLDIHTRESGYQELVPPFIANRESLFGTGQLPKFEEDLFKLQGREQYLIPTSEVTVTNFYRDDMLAEKDLPQAFTAYSPCFRAEAGGYGKDTKGIIRQHQFNKVEIVRFTHPSNSYEQHELLLKHAETILQRLGLHYRTMTLCAGDTGFSAAKTYDIEVWLPGQNAYREISSCSNFEDFQARRANIRFRPAAGGKPEFVHTLNGSGLAVGRTFVAILENFQQEDGSVLIPKALQSYTGFEKISAN